MSQVTTLSLDKALTGTETDCDTISNVYGLDQHSLYVYYTPGASGNVLTVKIYIDGDAPNSISSRDNAVWTQFGFYTNSSGVLAQETREIQYTATGTSQVLLVPYNFACIGYRVKVSLSESGGTNGTYSAILFSKNT